MKNFFDYMYYRVAKVYMRWDGMRAATAEVSVSMVQSVIIIDAVAIILKLTIGVDKLVPYSRSIAYGGVGLCILLMIVNHIRYNGKFEYLRKVYEKQNSRRNKVGGFLVICALIIPWIILILLGN